MIFLPGKKPNSSKLILTGEERISRIFPVLFNGSLSAVMGSISPRLAKIAVFGMNLKKNKEDFYQFSH